MINELELQVMNEAWRELFPLPDVRKYVLVKRTDELVVDVKWKLPDLVWCRLPTECLTAEVNSP